MHGPATVGWLLVALCAVTGLVCVLRSRGPGCGQRVGAQSEAAMGFAMAAMSVPLLWGGSPVLHRASAWVFTAVFAALLARELWLLTADRHGTASPPAKLHHLLGSAAMTYMALAMALGAPAGTHPAGTGGHHSAPGGVPVVTGVLLAYFAGYVLWTGARLLPTEAGGPVPAGGPGQLEGTRSPSAVQHAQVAAGCEVAMGAAMFAMLLTV
ncbi:DUF5134 domain-containing protein [Streptomyces spirodelae]|uniref:DUF5134 domain-containing protein n=1 Tax=Streptomyces spirodelae TaxID=2812904 RepID=A0ABS3WX10_9ACTN|nr:DUF5134 domain-containing protein [Streptomyces spirodelae]MBO8187658.1 DUF5134 domain-containing protein [Streptomyces spirodelae]